VTTTPEPLDEETEAPMLDLDPGADPEPYGYEPTPDQDKARLIGLVTRGRPFVLITLLDDGQAAVDAAGLDLVAAYATVTTVAEALSRQIDQL
jgi:hypothetical protein